MISVHQAKGMEFPVVFVADMSHESGGAAPRVMVDREMGLAVRTDEETEEGDRESAVLYDLVRLNDARRERAEDLRVLYVALTRARDHLVLSGWLRNNRPPARSWLRLVAEQYDLVDDSGTVAESLVFGEEAFAAPVHTEVPEVAVDVGRRGHHAAWKVVRRLDRMGRRFGEVASIPPFERAEYVEPIATELQFKRRFVPSEFTEYRYCAQRYRLSRIVGVPAFESGSRGTGGAPDGALLGTVVHRALAGWDFVATASLEACIDQALASEGLTQTVAGNALRESALAMVTSAQAAGLFDEIAASRERHSEFPLAARVGDFIIDGIIDMVHRVDDGTFEIVDYKTDGVDAAGTAEAAANYALQVGAYAVALSKSGRAVSRVSLLFVRAGRRHAWRCDAKQLGAWEHELCSTVADIRSGRFDETHEGPCRCGLGWACGRGASEVDDLDMV